jgi:hypothetical protein
MPRSVYFNLGNTPEQRLHEDIVVEALRIYGHDVYYLPRSIVKLDNILNEDVVSKFGEAFKLEAYIENIDAYGGDGVLMSKFGLQIRDQMNVIVSRKRWNQLVGRFKIDGELPRPGEGDLIYFPMGQALMEIKFVENKAPFFQLQQLPTYRLVLEMFEYSGEEINTGIEDIDVIGLTKTNPIELTLESYTGQFSVGETISSEDNSQHTAKVVSHEGTKLVITDVRTDDSQYKTFSGESITGADSGATAVVSEADYMSAMAAADHTAQNEAFELKANDIIDFTEINPFGEANYRSN